MKIGLISDTHDNIQNIRKAVREFNDKHVDVVIHAGDFVSPIAVESLAGVKLVGVLGNNDTDIPGISSTFNKIHGELKGEIFEIVYDGMKFCLSWALTLQKDQLIKSGKYDVFIMDIHIEKIIDILELQELSIQARLKDGFWTFATIAVFDTSSRNLEFINL